MLRDKIKEIRKNRGRNPSWEVIEKIGIVLGVCPKKLIVMWCSHMEKCDNCSYKQV